MLKIKVWVHINFCFHEIPKNTYCSDIFCLLDNYLKKNIMWKDFIYMFTHCTFSRGQSFYVYKCTIIIVGLFSYRCRECECILIKTIVLISIYLNIHIMYDIHARIKKFFLGVWGILRRPNFSAESGLSWPPPPSTRSALAHALALASLYSNVLYLKYYLCKLCQNSYNDIPFCLQGPYLEPKTSCWLYLWSKTI